MLWSVVGVGDLNFIEGLLYWGSCKFGTDRFVLFGWYGILTMVLVFFCWGWLIDLTC